MAHAPVLKGAGDTCARNTCNCSLFTRSDEITCSSVQVPSVGKLRPPASRVVPFRGRSRLRLAVTWFGRKTLHLTLLMTETCY